MSYTIRGYFALSVGGVFQPSGSPVVSVSIQSQSSLLILLQGRDHSVSVLLEKNETENYLAFILVHSDVDAPIVFCSDTVFLERVGCLERNV